MTSQTVSHLPFMVLLASVYICLTIESNAQTITIGPGATGALTIGGLAGVSLPPTITRVEVSPLGTNQLKLTFESTLPKPTPVTATAIKIKNPSETVEIKPLSRTSLKVRKEEAQTVTLSISPPPPPDHVESPHVHVHLHKKDDDNKQ